MNQDNNRNGQNGIPDIFQVPGNNTPNNMEPKAPIEPNLIDSIPVFDIPNFSDTANTEEVSNVALGQSEQAPVFATPEPAIVSSSKVEAISPFETIHESTPVAMPNASLESNVGPSVSNPVSSNSEPEKKEEQNPWVASLEREEAEESEKVVIPQEPKEPVVAKPMTPLTVDDLITAEAPVVSEPEPKKKPIPWKFIAIIGGVIAAIILIVVVVALFNKAGNKTLSCSLSDTNAGMQYRTTNTFVFKGKKMETLGTKVEYIATDNADHTTELATLKTAISYMDEGMKKLTGATTKLDATDKSVTYSITLKRNEIKVEEWQQNQEQFVDVTAIEYLEKDYNTIKKEMTESRYTCK